MAEKFLQRARASMESKGTVGAFTKQAKGAHEGVQEYASKQLAHPSSEKERRRAQFAKNMQTIANRRKG